MKAFTPNGKQIIGTLEIIQGRAEALEYTKCDDGELVPDYLGDTEMFWDSQETATNPDGKMIYLDDDGGEWTADQLTLKDEEP